MPTAKSIFIAREGLKKLHTWWCPNLSNEINLHVDCRYFRGLKQRGLPSHFSHLELKLEGQSQERYSNTPCCLRTLENTNKGSLSSRKCGGDRPGNYRARRKAQARYWREITGRNDKSRRGGEGLMKTSQSEVALELFWRSRLPKSKEGGGNKKCILGKSSSIYKYMAA